MRLVAASLLVLLTHTAQASQRIEEASYISIGGIDQWVTIRGDDDRKPILLLLHGGPGDVQSSFVSTYAPYERDFVLVQWDQRGAGRTFERYGQETVNLTLERQVADGVELAERLHARFAANKLILLGHSWGTIVGSAMAQRRPDLFSAYVGTGQVSSWAAIVKYQFEFALATARARQDAETAAQFEAIGRPDPTNIGQYFGVIARAVRLYAPASDVAWLSDTDERLRTQNVSEADAKVASAGANFSARALLQELVHADLTSSVPVFKIPVYVIQGGGDLNTPTDTARVFFETVQAPRKKMMVVNDAGHFALATHQAAFIAALRATLGD